MRRMWIGIAVVLVAATVWGNGSLAWAQQGAAATSQATAAAAEPAAASAPATAKKFRGRLPMYFSSVVTETQRRQIYEVQREYYERINALKAQLAAMVQEQDEKIDAVLSDEQRQQVETLRASAKSKRQSGRADEEQK